MFFYNGGLLLLLSARAIRTIDTNRKYSVDPISVRDVGSKERTRGVGERGGIPSCYETLDEDLTSLYSFLIPLDGQKMYSLNHLGIFSSFRRDIVVALSLFIAY